MDEELQTKGQKSFPYEQRALLFECITNLRHVFETRLTALIKQAVDHSEPPKEITDVAIPIGQLYEYLESMNKMNPSQYIKNQSQNSPTQDRLLIPENQLPVLKRAIMLHRRVRALAIEDLKEKTHNPGLLAILEAQLQPLNDLTDEQWFRETTPVNLPSLTNYFRMDRIESILRDQKAQLEPRQYDEKFHILQAQSLFLSDLNYYRQTCEMRNVPVVVAHIDIDDFKTKFNNTYKHVTVDRNVLPRFMMCLESHVHSHGYGYRYGGDEYALIIPSVSSSLAVLFLDELREKLGAINYRDIQERTTVSIGFCVVDKDCFLTDREIEERANIAMNFAKEKGKNCLATYRSSHFDTSELYVVSPESD